jgi:hypothetical protein
MKAARAAPGVFWKASRASGYRVPSVARRFALAMKHRYEPGEAFETGVLDPDTPLDVFSKYASRSEMARLQKALNPDEWEWLLADKGIFYRYCLLHRLPIPGLLGLWFKEQAGWSPEGLPIDTQERWGDLFLRRFPTEFVVKPARSVYGDGIRIMTRDGSDLVDHEGNRQSVHEFLVSLESHPSYTSFVLQERLANHPGLAMMSGGCGVLSVRVITQLDRTGVPRVLTSNLKVIVGDNIVSNNRHGALGNLVAEIDIERGVIEFCAGGDAAHGGHVSVERHPDTGAVFAGARIPQWTAVLDLALRAASVFAPVRTVGWDVAVTPFGVRLLEGNIWYDPPTHAGRTGALLSRMEQLR